MIDKSPRRNWLASPSLNSLQCGRCGILSDSMARQCVSCGGFLVRSSFDPFLHGDFIRSRKPQRIDLKARKVIRLGVLLLGLVTMASGLLLVLAGYAATHSDLSFDSGNLVQLWVARITAPILITHGLFHLCIPFRSPPAAEIIPIKRKAL